MITNFKIFESIPKNNVASIKINNKDFNFNVGELYNFVELKKYKPTKIDIKII